MATDGFDPFDKLHELFWTRCPLTSVPLQDEQDMPFKAIMEAIELYVRADDHQSLLGCWLKLREECPYVGSNEKRRLTVEEADLADAMLDCIHMGWTPPSRDMKLGVYDHFKGGVYLVRGFSFWASGHGELVIEYTSLLHGTHHCRLASQWCEAVRWPDGKWRSRFVYRGPDLDTPPPAFKVQPH
jgi:hypothetical protein